ncbi:MAG: 50S ribosomal protein L13 [Candidatus Levybacteria bacterium RIFCSPHIGHO2_02_FULL_37_10]|nr:MAG: 50S ribosomal protein L13 [Candidatus Levybacteria bacterium RIFCSPHIGHO2_02_FULL_37_10]OGH41618.1 MAG: 50S ribosomal protein L13 [Candidatus Levybacteria bacterium RIFCSPLOWO2_02_FULL_36_8b]
MKNMTTPTKLSDIKRLWHLFDAKGKILGRISSEIAQILIGKSKPYFVNNLDCGDYVVVINASEVKTTGRKETQKKYSRHSGYPGGYREEALMELRKRNPVDIIRFAVSGMLPQNKLQDRMLTRLYIFKGAEHPYAAKFKK